MYFEYLFTFYAILKNILSTVILKKENTVTRIVRSIQSKFL